MYILIRILLIWNLLIISALCILQVQHNHNTNNLTHDNNNINHTLEPDNTNKQGNVMIDIINNIKLHITTYNGNTQYVGT